MSYLGVIAELGRYLRARKKWWLVPILAALLLVGGLLVLSQVSPVFAFIYTIF